MNGIGDSVKSRLTEIDARLEVIIPQKGQLEEEAKNLRQEKRDLERVVKQLNGTQREGPKVSDEQVLEAVKELGGKKIAGATVAEKLGVQPRNVARKLRKLVDNGQLAGDPTAGYTVAKT